MKFLQVIRFDNSDDHVFENPAQPGEWAVSGAFAFSTLDRGEIKGKLRQAFANGFLGLGSFGRSTFATICEMTGEKRESALEQLAAHFTNVYGAPSAQAAKDAADGEFGFITELCAEKPINTVFTVRRVFDDDGSIREEFREITPPSGGPRHAKVWEIVEDEP